MKTINDFNLTVFEKFPHVLNNIEHFWGSTDLFDYLDGLQVVSAERVTRQGFPNEVMKVIDDIHTYYRENVFDVIPHLTAAQKFEIKKKYLRYYDVWKGRG